jgi:hypothetical protein
VGFAKGEVGIKDRPPAPTFEEFSRRFLLWIATEKAAKPKTVQFYRDDLRSFAMHLSIKLTKG